MHIISKNYIFISLFQKLLHSYVKEAVALGVSNMDAKMMCANFRHQGGASAVKRILAKTTKPYTLDHLYAACQTDTGNQVGAYIYVPTLAGLFTNYASPKVGDIFMYHNGSEFSHTELVISVSGDKFVTIEGNTNDGSGVVAEGIGVYQKTRYNSQLPGGTVMGMVSKGTKLELDGTSSGVWVHVKVAGIGIGYMHQDYVGKDSGSTGSSPIKTAQNALNSGIDSSFGPSTKQGVIKFQTSQGLSADGIAGRDTFARLAGV